MSVLEGGLEQSTLLSSLSSPVSIPKSPDFLNMDLSILNPHPLPVARRGLAALSLVAIAKLILSSFI